MESKGGNGVFEDVYQSHDRLWLKPKWNSNAVCGLFSFRTGGVSDTPYDSLNLGLHVGDDVNQVIQNRRICAEELYGNLESWVVAEQVHGNKVACVDENHRGCGAKDHSSSILGVDGLITDKKDITLVVLSADCVPILFFDPVSNVIATAHSGWKGTLQHISAVVISTMAEKYHSNPRDIHVHLGPSIRKCCYEVNEAVAFPMMEQFGSRVLMKRFYAKDRYLLSLQDCIIQDLQKCGIEQNHIDDCGVCTGCHVPLIFSHRKEHGKTGRLAGAIRLLP